MIPMQLKQNPTINWQSENPVLKQGQVGYDTTLKIFKFGDGKTPWNSLTDYYEKAGSAPSLLSTTVVQSEITTKQNLYAIPAGKKCVVTLIVLRDGTPTLDTFSGQLSLGYDADALDYIAYPVQITQLMNAAKFLAVTAAGSSEQSQTISTVGAGGQIFGCAMGNGTEMPGTLKIEVFGYLVNA